MARGAEGGGAPLEPGAALTVGEAARLAGVSEAALRKRIQSGRLLHEVGRRGGREVQLVRLVDLVEVYPDTAREVAPPTGDPVPAPADLAPDPRHPRALEVRLTALQNRNDALASQMGELEARRTDLEHQCTDLRGRLTLAEKERQAATAGLLLAQDRRLELRAIAQGGAPGSDYRVWWRRGTSWGFATVALLLALVLRAQHVDSRDARESLEGLDGRIDLALSEAREERGELASELAAGRATERATERELRASLEAERAAGRAERGDLAQRLEALTAQALELSLLQESQRTEAAGARAALDRELSGARADTEAVRVLLEEERAAALAERRALADRLAERERGLAAERARTERTLGELTATVQASREEAALLRGSLAAAEEREIEREGRLGAVVARLEDLAVAWERAREREPAPSVMPPSPWEILWLILRARHDDAAREADPDREPDREPDQEDRSPSPPTEGDGSP